MRGALCVWYILIISIGSLHCENELGPDGMPGRYQTMIADNLPRIINVQLTGEFQSIFCKCKNDFWMVCHIYPARPVVQTGHDIQTEDMSFLGELRKAPFTTIKYLPLGRSTSLSPIIFSIPHVIENPVYAEIVFVFGAPRTLVDRKNSLFNLHNDLFAPWMAVQGDVETWPSGWPDHFVRISKCATNAKEVPACQVTNAPIKPNDFVWILKKTPPKPEVEVTCVSIEGMDKLDSSEKMVQKQGYPANFQRSDGDIFSKKEDYQGYIVVDDSTRFDERSYLSGKHAEFISKSSSPSSSSDTSFNYELILSQLDFLPNSPSPKSPQSNRPLTPPTRTERTPSDAGSSQTQDFTAPSPPLPHELNTPSDPKGAQGSSVSSGENEPMSVSLARASIESMEISPANQNQEKRVSFTFSTNSQVSFLCFFIVLAISISSYLKNKQSNHLAYIEFQDVDPF